MLTFKEFYLQTGYSASSDKTIFLGHFKNVLFSIPSRKI